MVAPARDRRRARGECGVGGRGSGGPGWPGPAAPPPMRHLRQASQELRPGGGERRWRGLDLGSTRCFLKAPAPRVRCQEHGVVVAQVPWADHGARSTRSFDDQVAWLAVHCDRSTASELMRVSWRTVGWIVARVSRRLGQRHDPLVGLRRIGRWPHVGVGFARVRRLGLVSPGSDLAAAVGQSRPIMPPMLRRRPHDRGGPPSGDPPTTAGERVAQVTTSGRIMSCSSCSRMWQCHTYSLPPVRGLEGTANGTVGSLNGT
jgi:Helix-turn-helix domain of transposase family ISL3/zinc-finger of transposase IS204/IS1001/IS1096/IS1165